MIYAGHVKVAPGKPQTCRVKYALGLLQRGVIYKTEHFGNPTKQTACSYVHVFHGWLYSKYRQSKQKIVNKPARARTSTGEMNLDKPEAEAVTAYLLGFITEQFWLVS